VIEVVGIPGEDTLTGSWVNLAGAGIAEIASIFVADMTIN
jgi:hypothetical protein